MLNLNQRSMFTLLKRDKRWLSQSTLKRIFSIRRDKKGFSSSGFWLLALSLISYKYTSCVYLVDSKVFKHKKPCLEAGLLKISRKCFLVSTADDLNSSQNQIIGIGSGINLWQVGLKIGTRVLAIKKHLLGCFRYPKVPILDGARTQIWTGDTAIFSRLLYQLSYPGLMPVSYTHLTLPTKRIV